jgi:hypothetical protein
MIASRAPHTHTHTVTHASASAHHSQQRLCVQRSPVHQINLYLGLVKTIKRGILQQWPYALKKRPWTHSNETIKHFHANFLFTILRNVLLVTSRLALMLRNWSANPITLWSLRFGPTNSQFGFQFDPNSDGLDKCLCSSRDHLQPSSYFFPNTTISSSLPRPR